MIQLSHLTDDEIEVYLKYGHVKSDVDKSQSVESHLSGCSLCLGRALEAQRAQLGLTNDSGKTPGPECPDKDEIQSVAAGICPSEKSLETIRHAAHCDVCGPFLKRCREEFAEDLSDAEDTFLSKLKTSRTGWQKRFVRNHATVQPAQPATERTTGIADRFAFRLGWRWATAAAAIVGLAVIATFQWPALADRIERSKVKQLATQALCEQPTIEMRLPNGCYAPFQKQMGEASDQKSESLLEAERILAHRKKAGPLDREWLQGEGLTSLVSGAPGSASRASISFERAQREGLDDPSLEIELAATYFEAEHPDLPKIIDLLEGVLQRPKLTAEERRVALYDLAIAYETIQAWPLAVARWQEYLKLDSSSDWAQEARRRRDKAQAKVPTLKPESRIVPPVPEHSALESHAEEYQDIALRFWLPEAVKDPQGRAAQASRELAVVLEKQHSDPWLTDLLRTTRHNDLPALLALGRAVSSNRRGLYRESIEQSQDAATIFARHHNLAGELRARLEEVYANQRALEAEVCVAGAQRLWNRVSHTKYRWLQAQLAVETATCLNLTANLNAAKEELVTGDKIADDSNFAVLRLRILALSAGIDRQQNRDSESWQKGVTGLAKCSEGIYPSERLYNFYSILEQVAQKKHFLHAQQALLRNAIAIREADPPEDKNVPLEGAIYGRLSTVYLALKEDALAREASQKSNLLLSLAPEEPYADNYVLFHKSELAESQLHLGEASAAINTLEPARDRVARVSTKLVALRFYRLLGEAYRQLGRLDAAANTFEQGIGIVETALSTLNDKTARLKWMGGADPLYRGRILVLLDQGKDEDALALWEWYRSRPVEERHPATEVSWSGLKTEIFHPLPVFASETRLIYASFDDRLQVWVTSAGGVKARSVKVRQSDLERQVSDFAQQCSTPPDRQPNQAELRGVPDDLRRAGRALSSLFLDAVMSEVVSGRVVVVELDPRLGKLPIAALISPDGRYFAQDHAIVLSPGAFWDKKLRPPQPIEVNAPLLLAQGTTRLPGQAELRDMIRDRFPNTTIVTPEKTPWNAAIGELRNREGFIFIGHGISESGGTALIYGDSRIGANDFAPAGMHALKLAVLEACSTSAGGENGPLETANLVHPFLTAGVPSVIASRWDVDSGSTANLMASFFSYLGHGEAVSQALFHARNDSLTLRSHPYYWAGLDLVGRAN